MVTGPPGTGTDPSAVWAVPSGPVPGAPFEPSGLGALDVGIGMPIGIYMGICIPIGIGIAAGDASGAEVVPAGGTGVPAGW